ncbi:MAG: dockerin type I repeat-containing protein, partial [Oscillospiraceae bacterium]|nr:dockerin type I repeat-containing protein [Oscillospiraceae bacterium]
TIKNTGLAPAFFNIDLCAEITDADGNRIKSFGKPIRIEKGTFRDETEKAFLFEYDGTPDENAVICLAMYESDNSLAAGKDPTVRFDNQNTLPTGRLKLVQTAPLTGDVNADGNFDLADAFLLQKWLLAVPDTQPADWKAGDFSGNGRLDAKDFALMKRALLA